MTPEHGLAPQRGDELSEFERTLATTLAHSPAHVSARVRSRLNQARQRALAEAAQPPSFFRALGTAPRLVPAGAFAAAALVALVLVSRTHEGADRLPLADVPHASAEDLELLADHEALDLVEGGDGVFYEWAAEQGDTGTESESG